MKNNTVSIVIGSWGSYNECNERALGSKWHDVSASEKEKFFEDSVWYENDTSLFDPYAPVVNLDFLKRFPEYKYCPYDKFQSTNILVACGFTSNFPKPNIY